MTCRHASQPYSSRSCSPAELRYASDCTAKVCSLTRTSKSYCLDPPRNLTHWGIVCSKYHAIWPIRPNLLVYPNPTDGTVQIVSGQQIKSISICDYTGRVLINKTCFSEQISIDLQDYKGLLLIQVILKDGQTLSRKVVFWKKLYVFYFPFWLGLPRQLDNFFAKFNCETNHFPKFLLIMWKMLLF